MQQLVLVQYIVFLPNILYSGPTGGRPVPLNVNPHAVHWNVSPDGANQVVQARWTRTGILSFAGSQWMKSVKCICHFHWQDCRVGASISARAQDVETSPGTMCSLTHVCFRMSSGLLFQYLQTLGSKKKQRLALKTTAERDKY